VERGYRSIISEPVVTSNDAEADYVALVVEDLEALRAICSGQAGDNVDLAECADVALADGDVAALDEVLVCLGVVESTDDGPDGGDGSGDLLDHGGAALVRAYRVDVIALDGFRHRGGAR